MQPTRRLSTYIVASVLGATGLVFVLLYLGTWLAADKTVSQAAHREGVGVARSIFAALYHLMSEGENRAQIDQFLDSYHSPDAEAAPYALRLYPLPGLGTTSGHAFTPSPMLPPDDAPARIAQRTGKESAVTVGGVVHVIVPFVATRGCTRCHTAAKAGDTVALLEVDYDVKEPVARARRSVLFLLLLLAPVPIVGAGLASRLLGGRIRRSVALVQHGFHRAHAVESVQTDTGAHPDLGFVEFNMLFANLVDTASRASSDLRRSEEHFRRTFDQSPIGAAISSLDHRFQRVNAALCTITGYSAAQLTSMSCGDLFHKDDARLHFEDSEALLSGNTDGIQRDMRCLRQDGSIVWVRLSSRLVRDATGRPLCLLPMMENINDRKLAEERLRQSETKFRTLVEAISDIIAILDGDGTLRYVSPSIERVSANPGDTYIGRNAREFVHPDDGPAVHSALKDLATRAVSTAELRVRIQTAGGSWRLLEAIAKVIDDPFNALKSDIVVTLRDVTEREQMVAERRALEDQLRQSQKMEAIGTLAGGIAHDFNNLLTAILGYAELLLEKTASDSTVNHDVREIEKAGRTAADLTKRLLAFSRKQVLNPTVLDLSSVVGSLQKILGRTIGEHIHLVTRLDPALGRVRADRSQCEQVIINLAVNARDAMANGGTLVIETANVERGVGCDPYVRLTVSDTGTGMTKEIQERIFEPFFTTKTRGKGTGLGLSTVYGIVEQSHGQISVSSVPGQGTKFDIYLPRVDDAVPVAALEASPTDAQRGSETVLVVDDDEGVMQLASTALEERGYTVLNASNGADAVATSERYEGPIHALITDMVMPGITGAELSMQIKASRPTVKVLYMSGYADEAQVPADLFESLHSFVSKPFTPTLLARKVREQLDR